MKSEATLEEVWRIKDDLAREASYDRRHHCENTRQWASTHPHPGFRVRDAEELRRLLKENERQRAEKRALILKDAQRQRDRKEG